MDTPLGRSSGSRTNSASIVLGADDLAQSSGDLTTTGRGYAVTQRHRDRPRVSTRELALPLGFVDVKVCAIDDVWSGLKLVVRKELR